jgi:diguanylate cyclase (GGDEF)-like protein/PAS domain S-box-containing protein
MGAKRSLRLPSGRRFGGRRVLPIKRLVAAETFDQAFNAYGSELLQRIAGTVAIMLYEMELRPDGSFECLTFVGLETLIGPVPDGMSSEEAYEAAVHPEDRELYDGATAGLWERESVEVEYRLIDASGEVRWVLDRMRPERECGDGCLRVSGVVADISERKRVEVEAMEKLAHAALHDSLTGLANRASFLDHLELGLKRAARNEKGVGVLFIDLDNFKLVNDSFGHAAGDELLKAVGSRLQSAVRGMDVVARQGGDEFLILLTDVASQTGEDVSPSPTDVVASKVRTILREPFLVDGIEIYVSASVGISSYPGDGADADTLLKHADVAMYSVKDSGRDGYARYSADGDSALEQISMAARLRKSVESGRGLVLHYQPLMNLETAEVVGVEALVRWQDGNRGLVQPDEFIPLAEQVGLIGSLSDWVVAEACRQASAWQKEGMDFYVSINVPPSYCQPTGMAHLAAAASAAGIELDNLMIEVTESALAPDRRTNLEDTLSDMHSQGLRLAIDDFGTGYSSLGRLNQTWVNMLKIDRSFVQELPVSEHACNLVSSVVRLAQSLGLEPLAEGVETEEQRRFLVDNGCRYGQGFLFSRPLPTDEIKPFYDGERGNRRDVA